MLAEKENLFLKMASFDGVCRWCMYLHWWRDSEGDSGKVLTLPPPLKAAQMFSRGQENISTSPASTKGPVKYGELIVLG